MTKKELLRSIAFVLVVCLLFIGLCEVFELSDVTYIPTRFKTFGNLNKDTVDAVWIGTSGVDRYWMAAKAYEEYGMTVFALASDAMPSFLFTNVIDEIYAKQDPELIIIDARAFGQANTKADTVDTRVRRVLDAMDFFSINRFKAAFKAMEILHRIDPERDRYDLSLPISFIKYHTMWADEDFSIEDNTSINAESEYMGFFVHNSLSIKEKKHKAVVYNSSVTKPLDPIAEESLYELLDYAENKNINLLFVCTPEMMTESEMGKMNTLFGILDEKGINYVNGCETDSKGNFTYFPDLNPSKDYYNENHVNYYGAEKFTSVIGAYLDEHYDFADHRSDETVKEDWDGVYEHIKDAIKEREEAAAAKK